MSRDSLYPEIGRRLKVRREKLEKTQDVVSKKLGISRASLANIEAGRQSILVHQLYALAEALDIDLHNLLPSNGYNIVYSDDAPLMPNDIKPAQAEQIRQLIQPDRISPKQSTGVHHVKPRK